MTETADNLAIEQAPDPRTESDPVPRWARDLDAEVWLRCNDLLDEGWKVSDVMTHLGIPEEKRRSLQLLNQKLAPRRRFNLFGEVKDSVLKGAAEITPLLIESLKKLAAMALAENVSEGTHERATKLMLEFVRMMMETHQAEAAGEVAAKPRLSTEQTVQRIEEILKVKLA